MTWGNRLRLIVGLIAVVAVTTAATYHLNESRGIAQSSTAEVAAESYAVGTAYAGLLVEQHVVVGQHVVEGQPMFVIDSAALRHDLSVGLAGTAVDAVDDQDRLVVRAAGQGVVTDVSVQQGTFVQASSELATVQLAGTMYVRAEFSLSAPDYARVAEDAAVTIVLPDGRRLAGQASGLTVAAAGDAANVVVMIASAELVAASSDPLVGAGTPVTAELQLRNDGVVTRTFDAVERYVGGLLP